MGTLKLAPMSDKIRKQLEKALLFIDEHLEQNLLL